MKVDSISKLTSHASFVCVILLGNLYASHLGVNVRWMLDWQMGSFVLWREYAIYIAIGYAADKRHCCTICYQSPA